MITGAHSHDHMVGPWLVHHAPEYPFPSGFKNNSPFPVHSYEVSRTAFNPAATASFALLTSSGLHLSTLSLLSSWCPTFGERVNQKAGEMKPRGASRHTSCSRTFVIASRICLLSCG